MAKAIKKVYHNRTLKITKIQSKTNKVHIIPHIGQHNHIRKTLAPLNANFDKNNHLVLFTILSCYKYRNHPQPLVIVNLKLPDFVSLRLPDFVSLRRPAFVSLQHLLIVMNLYKLLKWKHRKNQWDQIWDLVRLKKSLLLSNWIQKGWWVEADCSSIQAMKKKTHYLSLTSRQKSEIYDFLYC